MSIGTGIFLSSVLLAIVILYGLTKDRWGWRRFVRRTALVVLAIVVLFSLAGGGYYAWQQRPQTVTRQTEYAGLRLGMSPDEVMYIKGYPPFVLAEEAPNSEWKDFLLVIDTTKLEKGKKASDYKHWSFNAYESSINVAFNNERTAVTAIQCYSKDKLGRCPAIATVEDGDSEQEAVRKLGTKREQRIQGVTKSILWDDIGVRLHLTQEKIYMMEVSAPGYGRR